MSDKMTDAQRVLHSYTAGLMSLSEIDNSGASDADKALAYRQVAHFALVGLKVCGRRLESSQTAFNDVYEAVMALDAEVGEERRALDAGR